MDAKTSRLDVNVRVDPDEPNNPIVQLLVDGAQMSFTEKFIGFDPALILQGDLPLLATQEPRRIAIYRCNCGEPGCGSVAPVIKRNGTLVEWSDFREYVGVFARPTGFPDSEDDTRARVVEQSTVQFEAAQYEATIRQVSAGRSWESDDRKIARLVQAELSDRADELRQAGFKLQWAFPGLGRNLEIAFSRGRDGIVTEYATEDGSADEVAARIVSELLGTGPSDWPITKVSDNSATVMSQLHLDPQNLKRSSWADYRRSSRKKSEE